MCGLCISQAFSKTLLNNFITLRWIFQKDLNPPLKLCQNAGKLNELLHGYGILDVYQKIMKSELFMLKLWLLFHICTLY